MVPRSDRILIIDDDPSLIELLSAQLEASGFEPHTSLGGEDILNLLDQVRPDLLILDLMLPKVSGFEVLAVIRNSPTWKDLSIIILSALGDESSMVKGLKLGAQDYISKPFRRQELIARIERNLEVKHYEETLKIRNRQLETLLGNLDIILRKLSPSMREEDEARLILSEIVKAVPRCDVLGFVLEFAGLREVHLTFHCSMGMEEKKEVIATIMEDYLRLAGRADEPGEKPLEFIDDVSSARSPCRITADDLRAKVTVPLKRHERLFGMLYLASTEEGAFSEGDMYFMYALAGQTQSFVDKEREKERLRDEFLSLVAHDLKSPVMSITAYCQLLERGDQLSPGQRKEFLQSIIDINRYQRFIIDNIAIIPRVESEEMPLEKIIIPVSHIMDQMQDLFRGSLQFRGSRLTAEIEPRLRIVGDGELLERCTANILASIVESTKKAEIFLRAKRNGSAVTISIGSPHMSLDEDTISTIFHKYKAGKSPLVRGERGIGLYIAQRILDRHGSEINVKSEPGAGTTFTFALPVPSEEEG
jgi:DNA-binding response OmpR family regulator/signal transduction histidine kinase